MSRSVRKNWVRYYKDMVRMEEENARHFRAIGRGDIARFWRAPEVQDYHEKGKGWRPYWREDDDYYHRPAPGTIDYEEGWGDNPHPFSLP